MGHKPESQIEFHELELQVKYCNITKLGPTPSGHAHGSGRSPTAGEALRVPAAAPKPPDLPQVRPPPAAASQQHAQQRQGPIEPVAFLAPSCRLPGARGCCPEPLCGNAAGCMAVTASLLNSDAEAGIGGGGRPAVAAAPVPHTQTHARAASRSAWPSFMRGGGGDFLDRHASGGSDVAEGGGGGGMIEARVGRNDWLTGIEGVFTVKGRRSAAPALQLCNDSPKSCRRPCAMKICLRSRGG